ncbi:single myb histone 4-like [Fagus crenata]
MEITLRAPMMKDILQPKQLQSISYVTATTGDTVEAAAETAAYKIAEAENKAFVAAEAVKEAERISKMAEDTDSFFQFAKEIFEKCNIQSPDSQLILPLISHFL